jgi:hypothetical protein
LVEAGAPRSAGKLALARWLDEEHAAPTSLDLSWPPILPKRVRPLPVFIRSVIESEWRKAIFAPVARIHMN